MAGMPYTIPMAESDSPLERLASGLSLDERKELLRKLTLHSHISEVLLYTEEEGGGLPAGEQFNRLSPLFRFLYSLFSLFKARPAAKLYEDHRINEVGRRIARKASGIYDYKKDRLLAVFYKHFEQLKDAARFFHMALDEGFNRDRKGFFGFLGSLEMEDLHLRIQEETELEMLEKRFPGLEDAELQKKALQVVESILDALTEENRAVMYFDSRSLFCLKELASFPFDRVLRAFASDTRTNRLWCHTNVIRDQLFMLNNILFSMKGIPSMPLLESMFVFLPREDRKTSDNDLERIMNRAEECLEDIRKFNYAVPLTAILRCSSRNLGVSPKEISGGEDWLSVYREYWKRRIEEVFKARMGGRREQKLRDTFGALVNGFTFKPLADAASAENPDGIAFRGAYTLAFLDAFYSAVFMTEINETLHIVLTEGDILLKEDAVEFTESYNTFFTLGAVIRKFEKELSPGGDLGMRYLKAKQELNTQPMIKRRKIESVSYEASAAALAIIKTVHQAARTMAALLEKFTLPGVDGRYAALPNITALTAKVPTFLPALAGIITRFRQLAEVLDDVDALENGN